MAETVWERRWRRLKAEGLDRLQAQAVYDMLEDARAFGSETIAISAEDKLREVYEPEVETYVGNVEQALGEPATCLVMVYPTGTVTVAFRRQDERTWGPPAEVHRG